MQQKSGIDQTQENPAGTPQTLAQLIRLLIAGIIKGFWTNKRMIIGMILVTWIVHTYLLVVINEGFNYTPGSLVSATLALGGHEISGTLFWILLGGIISTLYYTIHNGKLPKTITNIHSTPAWIRDSHQRAGSSAIPVLLAGGAFALVAVWLLDNVLVNLQLALLMTGALISQKESLLALAIRLGWSDWHNHFKKGQPVQPFNMAWAVIGITGAAIGFLMGTLIPLYIAFILLAGVLIVFLLKKKGYLAPKTTQGLLVMTFALAVMAIVASADDGGWQESGGTFENWIASEGAMVAIINGLPPALGGAIGVLLGGAIAGGAAGGIAGVGAGAAAGAGGVPGSGSPSTDGNNTQGTGQPVEPGLYDKGEGALIDGTKSPWFDLVKNLVGSSSAIAGSFSEFFTFPDNAKVIGAIRDAANAWRSNPTKEAAEEYIKSIRGTKDIRLKNLAGKLDMAGKAVDMIDAIGNGLNKANERGFTGVDKILTVGAELGKKGLTWMLTKNPMVGLLDSAVGGATQMALGKDGRVDIGGMIDKGADAWDKSTQEYFHNTQGGSDADAQITTQDQFLHLIRRIKEQVNQGKLTREQGSQRMHHLHDTMFGGN